MPEEKQACLCRQRTPTVKKCAKIRNLVGFWFIGLCNNFGYNVMLSAAHDILADPTGTAHGGIDGYDNITSATPHDVPENRSDKLILECNTVGTGAVLLADVLPALIIKLTAPWYIQRVSYRLRVILIVSLSVASFVIVALATQMWLILFGVIIVSCGMGAGELTFLALTSQFSKNSVSTWSSGTGAAGLVGSLLYASITAVGLSPRTTLLIMVVVPLMLAISYFLILQRDETVVVAEEIPQAEEKQIVSGEEGVEEGKQFLEVLDDVNNGEKEKLGIQSLSFPQKLALVKPLLIDIIPLCLVYFVEYFINQALYELIYFEDIWLPTEQQYRWYQTIFRCGVFVAKSSVNCIKIQKVWVLAVIQFMNLGVLLSQVLLQYMPSVWIVFAIVLIEGLTGGLTYVNAYYNITVTIADVERREYSMGVASLSDSLGVFLAGVISLPVHNYICTL